LVNARQEIVSLFGATERYLVQPTGLLTPDLLAWSREGLRSTLRTALGQSTQERRRVTLAGGAVKVGGETKVARITVQPLTVPKEVEGMFLVVFEEDAAPLAGGRPATAGPSDESALRQTEYELDVLREQLRGSEEQYESSSEELKSATEEMMSMNEELQSTNEELETSTEELQSLNEELTTVNGQLESKVQELEAANDDLSNLLSSTNIAVVFLDRQFRIKGFTPAMTALLSLLPSDLKRPISDFAQKFTDKRLLPDAQQVLATLAPVEAEVRTDTGHWYLRRILPYRTEEDRIDGVVVTFTDITERRKAEQERARLAAIVESSGATIIGKTLDGLVTSWNRGAEEMYGYTAQETVGRSIEVLVPPDRREELRSILRQVARGHVGQAESVRVHKDGRRLDVLLTVSPVYSADTGELIGASGVERDISGLKRAEEQARLAKELLEARVAQRTEELLDANRRLTQEVDERRRSEEARRTLLQRVLTIQDDERRRISRELHDQIGQQLAALALQLKAMESQADGLPALQACQEIAAELGRRLHDLALEVRPTALDELGLRSALTGYVEEWAGRHEIQLDYHERGFDSRRLPPAVEEAAYRIVLEALANVAKHARARRASLILERRAEELRIIIEDNGVGFDAEALTTRPTSQRLGMIGMAERAALVSGTFGVESQPGGGTTVFVQIPTLDGGEV
jgi:two-component system CheB/CheR fusion protein